jgi:hypothetical protein
MRPYRQPGYLCNQCVPVRTPHPLHGMASRDTRVYQAQEHSLTDTSLVSEMRPCTHFLGAACQAGACREGAYPGEAYQGAASEGGLASARWEARKTARYLLCIA